MTRALVVAAVAAAVVGGCRSEQKASATPASEPVVTVGAENTIVVTLTDLRAGPSISGSLEPVQAATVRAEVPGPIERTGPEAGEHVKRGEVLATLDDAAVRDAYLSARSAVRSAQSSLEIAKRNQERSERLEQAGAVPERDLETARLNTTNAEGALDDARARFAAASKQLEDTRVRAPFDGVVSDRHVDAGDVVQVGAELYTIVDPRRLRLEASVPANEIAGLKTGTPVEFTVTGSDQRVTGRIDRINPVVDPTTRQVRIYVTVPNTQQAFTAGLFAEGRVATETKRAVAVPITAVDNRGTNPVVHRLQAGRVVETPVQLGLRDEVAELVEIRSGVAAGDTVLLGSAESVAPGTRVRVLEEEAQR
ncbi:MAG TPA: efflux RND transporter periplasmic adaptor subunit [Gemmatimonadales bacterium]|nr:efflux RND transporter periplasmic adaptor subunit [Gemmatimonadales bacterium]